MAGGGSVTTISGERIGSSGSVLTAGGSLLGTGAVREALSNNEAEIVFLKKDSLP